MSKGWDNILAGNGSIHTVPAHDLERHPLTETCPCGPRRDPVEQRLFIHNAFDGRDLIEKLEEGKQITLTETEAFKLIDELKCGFLLERIPGYYWTASVWFRRENQPDWNIEVQHTDRVAAIEQVYHAGLRWLRNQGATPHGSAP